MLIGVLFPLESFGFIYLTNTPLFFQMDRVSNLPDEVLCHILSFLTTKEAALTSILAKRWRNLLAFVPSLTIDDSVFLHPEEGKQNRQDIIQSFMDFVDRVLALQGNSPLKEFSLKSFTVDDTDRVDGWISNVLARGVSDLDLKIIIRSDKWNFYPMSPKCFECSTLVKLSIGCGVDVTLAAARIFLPMLKTLVLVWVKVCPNEFETLLHALPSLEKLVLLRVIWKGRDVIVSSASVKTLIVNLGFWLNTLSFDTPSLVHFDYSGSAAWDYPVVNMENLVDTQIDFYLSQLHIKLLGAPGNDEDALPYSNAWKLFHGIRNVSHLSLFPDALEVRFLIQFLVHMTKRRSSFENVIPKYIVLFCLCFQVLSMCSESLPVFNNLNSLAIRSDKDRRWQAMPALLRNCPHLETLVIQV